MIKDAQPSAWIARIAEAGDHRLRLCVEIHAASTIPRELIMLASRLVVFVSI